jgi:hypothetical protein
MSKGGASDNLFVTNGNGDDLIRAGKGTADKHVADLQKLSLLTRQNLIGEAQGLAQAVEQQRGIDAIKDSGVRDLAVRAGVPAGLAATATGAVTGSPIAAKILGGAAGTLGALTTPFSVKAGTAVLNSPITSAGIGAALTRPMAGGSGVKAITKDQP